MPTLTGLKLVDAIKLAINSGFSIKISGNSSTAPDTASIIAEQSLPPGEVVKRGSVIIIRPMVNDFYD